MIKQLKYHLVALFVLQVALCFLYGYHKVYNKRPFSVHQWRQTDCASFTKNYYEEGMQFLQPKIHWQGSIEGKTVSEFPLINYTVACLWKVFGEHEALYRLTVLFIYILSLLFLFVMIYITSHSLAYSYFATSLISTSPVLAYYSFSFLADVPALSFAIISLSLFFMFIKTKKLSHFLPAVIVGTLATLLKASAATVLLIIGTVSMLTMFPVIPFFKAEEKLFKNKFVPLITLALSAFSIYSWYHFAFLYNNQNSNGVFLMDILPLWNTPHKLETARALFNEQLPMCFNKGVLCALGIAIVWLLLNLNKLSFVLRMSLLISLVSAMAFILLFFEVFNVHDYYLITTFILPVVVLVSFGNYLQKVSFTISGKKAILLCMSLFVCNAFYCASVMRLRIWDSGGKISAITPFISNDEAKLTDWFHYQYEQTLKPLETITPYLRSLGLQRVDKVISIPDPSFNISLYLMDQKGFTATEASLMADTNKLTGYKTLGAKYLILNDTNVLKLNSIKNLNKSKIGNYKNIFIYKLNP